MNSDPRTRVVVYVSPFPVLRYLHGLYLRRKLKTSGGPHIYFPLAQGPVELPVPRSARPQLTRQTPCCRCHRRCGVLGRPCWICHRRCGILGRSCWRCHRRCGVLGRPCWGCRRRWGVLAGDVTAGLTFFGRSCCSCHRRCDVVGSL